jgi:hypothetical protein
MTERTVWRCFPWDPDAAPGAPFSPTHLTNGQTIGRFDLHDRPLVRYLAESPEHAIGEVLSAFRGTTFVPAYLRRQGHALALVEVTLAPALADRIAECTDPTVLSDLAIRPDALAHHDRTVTQAIARHIHTSGMRESGYAGLRWWSALTGAWHTTVLFTDREGPNEVAFATPRVVQLDDPAVRSALTTLGIRVR